MAATAASQRLRSWRHWRMPRLGWPFSPCARACTHVKQAFHSWRLVTSHWLRCACAGVRA